VQKINTNKIGKASINSEKYLNPSPAGKMGRKKPEEVQKARFSQKKDYRR